MNQGCDDPHVAVVTAGADAQRGAGQRFIPIPIVDGECAKAHWFGADRRAEQVSAFGEVLAAMTMAQEAVVADPVES